MPKKLLDQFSATGSGENLGEKVGNVEFTSNLCHTTDSLCATFTDAMVTNGEMLLGETPFNSG